MTTALPSHLTDDALLSEVQRLAGAERQATVQLVAHLAVLDERRLYLRAGFPSLFAYCVGALYLAEHATYNRIEAARAARAFPVVLDRLADGSVTLTTIRLLAPHLTAANHDLLLREATHRTKEQVLELIARIAPRPNVAPSIRKLLARTIAPATMPPPPVVPAAAIMPAAPVPPARPAAVAPLAPDR